MGTYSKDTHATGSQAALIGGTTTFIEMCAPAGSDDTLEGYKHWKSLAEGNAACDYAFHMGVTRFDEQTETQLREIVADGTTSFKVFLAYKGAFSLNDEGLYKTLTLAKELGVIKTAHTENAELVAQLQQKLLSEGKTGPEWHEPSRPGICRGGRCASLYDVFGGDRGERLYRSPVVRTGAGRGFGGQSQRCRRVYRGGDSAPAAKKPTLNAPTLRVPSL